MSGTKTPEELAMEYMLLWRNPDGSYNPINQKMHRIWAEITSLVAPAKASTYVANAERTLELVNPHKKRR